MFMMIEVGKNDWHGTQRATSKCTATALVCQLC